MWVLGGRQSELGGSCSELLVIGRVSRVLVRQGELRLVIGRVSELGRVS